MEQNDAEELVARAARNIEQLLRKRSAALKVRLIPLRGTNCQFVSLKAEQDGGFINKGCKRGEKSVPSVSTMYIQWGNL